MGDFHYFDPQTGNDRGRGIRTLTKQILDLLRDTQALNKLRNDARVQRQKLGGINQTAIGSSSYGGGGSNWNSSGGGGGYNSNYSSNQYKSRSNEDDNPYKSNYDSYKNKSDDDEDKKKKRRKKRKRRKNMTVTPINRVILRLKNVKKRR